MYKAKQRFSTLLWACFAVLVSVLLAVTLWTTPTNIQANAAEATLAATFEFGENGAASHKDGSTNKASYSETNNGYTLSITGATNMYPSSYDAKGNSCIKLGASSKAASFSFTVPDDIVQVTFYIAKYKANTSKVTINGTTTTLSGASNNGVYDKIVIDTSSTKTVSLTTISGGYRAMLNTIEFYKAASDEPACEHANTTSTTEAPTCTEAGSITVTCDDCGETVSTKTISATGHNSDITLDAVDPTCTETGLTEGKQCSVCNAITKVQEEVDALGHNFSDPIYTSNNDGTHIATGTCTVCSETDDEAQDCDYERTEDASSFIYTCEHCEYSYPVAKYTITYNTPNGITAPDAVKVEANKAYTLDSADTLEGYTFVGWTTTELDEKTEEAPEYWTAGTEYTVTEDVSFYALYSYAEGTDAWTLVTDASTLAVGKEIVIVASGSNHALGADKGNNRNAATITKDGDTVTINNDVQIITLEVGNKADTFAFNVGNGYLYAASSGSNYLKTKTTLDDNGSWLITIDANGVATIKAQGTYTRNWLRKNSSSELFACYSSSQNDVSIYMKDGATYYVTVFNTCQHTNTEEVIEAATCTESGSRTVTCLDCESQIEAEILPALGHNYVEGICDNCGLQDPDSIVYDGYYYLILNNKYLDTTTLDGKNRYKPVDFTPGATVELNYVFHFVKNGDTYDMYDLTNGLYMENVTVTPNNDYTVNIYNAEGNILSHNSTADYVGFYKTTNSYARDFTFTEVELPIKINGASVTLGEDIALNYYVTIPEEIVSDTPLVFTMNGENLDVKGVVQQDGRYKYSLELPPQYMADKVQAVLSYNGVIVDQLDNYSIKAYAESQLSTASGELKQLLSDMLHYGAAAQIYKGYNVENLANADVEGILGASTATPETTNFALTNNEEVDSYPAYFAGAGVHFDNVNQLYVRLNTTAATKAVTLTINGVEVEITGTTVYTDGIFVTDFDETYRFVLSHGGVVMQTLTYSINAYAYAMQDNATMQDLALALYRYGVSAEAYQEYLKNLNA